LGHPWERRKRSRTVVGPETSPGKIYECPKFENLNFKRKLLEKHQKMNFKKKYLEVEKSYEAVNWVYFSTH